MRRLADGFTLIELLVVVAIIAILAAIAIPNLLEAQVRAKVTRARADLRTIATALEMVAVDTGRYPGGLSFPLNYMTSIPNDPFPTMEGSTPGTYAQYRYYNLMDGPVLPDPLLQDQVARASGGWLLFSVGPDTSFFNTPPSASSLPIRVFRDYDPTNGTISLGNVFRGRRDPSRFGAEPYFYTTP